MENSISALFILLVAFILFALIFNKTNDYYGGGKSTHLTSGLPAGKSQTPMGSNPPPNIVTGRVGGYDDMPMPMPIPYDITNDII